MGAEALEKKFIGVRSMMLTTFTGSRAREPMTTAASQVRCRRRAGVNLGDGIP